MSTYQLLRNNKSSGPYTFEEMISMGFKPYDLIWIDGKSAAWRYPGEISEFKAYAPLVEEQPYDRFYKKKNPEKEQEIKKEPYNKKQYEKADEKIPNKNFSQIAAVAPKIDNADIKEYTFPDKKILSDKSEPAKPDLNNNITETRKTTIPEKEPYPEKENTKTPPPVIIEYSGSLNEIKEMYRENLQRRNDEYKRKEKTRAFIRKIPAFLYVLVLGVLIGLTINVGKNKNYQASIPEDNFNTKALKQKNVYTNQGKQSTIDNYDMFTKTAGDIVTGETLTSQNGQPENRNKENSVTEDKPRKRSNENKPVNFKPLQDGEIQNGITANTEQETKPVKNEEPRKKIIDINSLVTVSANNYKRGAFGGIKNLELKVKNSSAFLLDNVEVELTYLKPSEQPLKTEKIHFKSVAPNGSLTIQVPDNSRGVKVECKINGITSAGYADYVAGM
jgi:hypothetical protein